MSTTESVSLICENKLKEELSDFYNNIDDEIINRLKDLCAIHGLTEDIICAELLSYVLKWDRKELNLDLINDFQTDYLDKKAVNDYKKTLVSKSRPQNTNQINTSFNSSFNSLLNECLKETKITEEPKLTTQIEIVSSDENELTPEIQILEKTIDESIGVSSQLSPTHSMEETINSSLKFSQNSKILCYFGNSLSDFEWFNRSKTKLNVQHFDKSMALTENYKFMSLKIKESNEILNDIIDEFSEVARKEFDVDIWSRFSLQSPTESYYIGRVCCDVSKDKLDEYSVRFETSNYISDNESIRIDLTKTESYSLFPGQVIACKAINESGKSLFVKEILDFTKLLRSPKTAPNLKQALHLAVAVGPFTNPNDLNFEPLKKVMEYIKEYKPDFCIFIGPFLDSSNEKLLTIDEPIDRIFNNKMRFICEEIVDIKTEVIIIPSTKDINVFNVLPTMPFNSYKSPKIHYFSNPSLIDINGVIIGFTSTDILLDLSKSEISAGQTGDRMSRLCRHVLSQRSFYPLFPPNPEINLEFPQYDYMTFPVTPHILLLPSDLKEFIKGVCGSIVINSGRLLKNRLTRIKVEPLDINSFNGSIESHTSVEIIKIDI